jgi:hypothetical protein
VWALTALLLFVGYVRARRRHHQTLRVWERQEAAELASGGDTQGFPVAASKPPAEATPQAVHRLDAVMDRFQVRSSPPAEVPTVEHEGESYTLH